MLCVFKFARSLSEEDRAALDEALSLPLEHIIVSHRTGNLISCPRDESGVDCVTALRVSIESFVLVIPHPAAEDTEAGPKKEQESVLQVKIQRIGAVARRRIKFQPLNMQSCVCRRAKDSPSRLQSP